MSLRIRALSPPLGCIGVAVVLNLSATDVGGATVPDGQATAVVAAMVSSAKTQLYSKPVIVTIFFIIGITFSCCNGGSCFSFFAKKT
jgi:cytochrome c oxidase assembly factor CtaG